jgi:hypothetical protein
MSLTLGKWRAGVGGEEAQGEFGPAQAIGWKRKGVLIAGAVFEKHNGANVYMHIALDGTSSRRPSWRRSWTTPSIS